MGGGVGKMPTGKWNGGERTNPRVQSGHYDRVENTVGDGCTTLGLERSGCMTKFELWVYLMTQ